MFYLEVVLLVDLLYQEVLQLVLILIELLYLGLLILV